MSRRRRRKTSTALVPTTLASRTSPAVLPQSVAAALTRTWDGRVPIGNAAMYRYWAKYSEWIRGAVNIRRSQISSAEWDIVPYDQRKPYSKRLQQRVKRQFQRPNPTNTSYRSFVEPVVNDLVILDAGVIEKVRNLYGELLELYPVDAAQIRVNALWDGDPKNYRYYWYPDGQPRAAFTSQDMVYMMTNPRTEWPIGLPMLETLKLTIEAELSAHEYNRRQVEGAAPDGVLDLGEGISKEQVDAFQAYFAAEIAGQGTLGFIGGGKGAQFIQFRDSNREMQFLEWQIYLVRKIAVVMGITPQDLGITFDVNRSTSETQIQISEDRGLRPLMSVVQEYFTQEIVWDQAYGGPDNNLAFRFTALNLKESTARANINQTALAGVPWRYVNEARIAEGREPIPELEGKLIMATPMGALDISDVPTVREYLDMQAAKKEPTPTPPSGEKSVIVEGSSVRVDAPDLSPIERMVGALNAPQLTSGTPVINVTNMPPGTMLPPEPKLVGRNASFIRGENGDIVGKREVQRFDDGTTKVMRTDYLIEGKDIVGKVESEEVDGSQ